MVDPAQGPGQGPRPAPRAPGDRFEGVGLTQYATVLAGRADGLRLDELLAFAGVEAGAWPRAEAAWEARLLDDLEADGELCEAFDARFAEALGRWPRPLPPLDGDLRAWLDFQRAWAHERDAGAFLAALGMHGADMIRLATHWKARLGADRALAAEAIAVLSEAPREPPVPTPAPAALPPRLTLTQYASLRVTLADAPARAAETLRLYRLGPEEKARLDARWEAATAADPALAAAFAEACATYRAYLSASRRTP